MEKQNIKLRAILPALGAANPVIDVFDCNGPPVTFDRRSQLAPLVLGRLAEFLEKLLLLGPPLSNQFLLVFIPDVPMGV